MLTTNASRENIDPLMNLLKFWFYLIILIPSIVCSLFVLYYLIFDRILRRALHNHAIIVLLLICLICQMTIYPWMLYFYHNGTIWYRSITFCSIWGFIDWGLYITQNILFAWASIERHILIFHDRWVSTRKKRILVHYFPLIFLMFYCFTFYSVTFFIPVCQRSVNNYAAVCLIVCSNDIKAFKMWETIAHRILPNLIIVIVSFALLLRVVSQKYRLRQRFQWRRHRKMTIQLLLISFLYLILSFPNIIVAVLMLSKLSNQIDADVGIYSDFFTYLVILLFPFVCIFSVPDLKKKINKFFFYNRSSISVSPFTLTIRHNGEPNRYINALEHTIR